MNPAKRNARLFREKEKLSGSLFGKIKDFDFGENAEFNIDKLIESIKISIAGGVKNEYPFLLLWLEAPLQSWGVDSKFGRRDSIHFPTKSGVTGLLLCALGASGEQRGCC